MPGLFHRAFLKTKDFFPAYCLTCKQESTLRFLSNQPRHDPLPENLFFHYHIALEVQFPFVPEGAVGAVVLSGRRFNGTFFGYCPAMGSSFNFFNCPHLGSISSALEFSSGEEE